LFSWLVVVFVVGHVLVFVRVAVLVLVLETVRDLPLVTRVTPGP
jgi:hypothetical protein